MNKVVVLFSGGQDSTTCLLYALNHFDQVFTLGFSYGQRHSGELKARQNILGIIRQEKPALAARLGQDTICDLSTLNQLTTSALTSNRSIEWKDNSLPTSFVPARNLIFLSLAAALAYEQEAFAIIIGVSQTDYSGYPDCRSETIQSMAKSLSLGLDRKIQILTPLMDLTKAATWELANSLNGEWAVNLILNETLTCYLGETTKNSWGYGCGQCPACILRRKGFEEYLARKEASH